MSPTTTAGVSESAPVDIPQSDKEADDGSSDGFVSMEASNMTTSLTTDSEQGKCQSVEVRHC